MLLLLKKAEAQARGDKMSDLNPEETELLRKIKSALQAEEDAALLVKVKAAQQEAAKVDGYKSSYATPVEALKVVKEDFAYWTGNITDISFKLSFAVIACNWAVFGSWNKINDNDLSKWSIAVVLLCLVISLIGAYLLGKMLRNRYYYAEKDIGRWEKEFLTQREPMDPWPETTEIELLSIGLRGCKVILPLLGGVLFILAILCP